LITAHSTRKTIPITYDIEDDFYFEDFSKTNSDVSYEFEIDNLDFPFVSFWSDIEMSSLGSYNNSVVSNIFGTNRYKFF
jgi:hypothetical protein